MKNLGVNMYLIAGLVDKVSFSTKISSNHTIHIK